VLGTRYTSEEGMVNNALALIHSRGGKTKRKKKKHLYPKNRVLLTTCAETNVFGPNFLYTPPAQSSFGFLHTGTMTKGTKSYITFPPYLI